MAWTEPIATMFGGGRTRGLSLKSTVNAFRLRMAWRNAKGTSARWVCTHGEISGFQVNAGMPTVSILIH